MLCDHTIFDCCFHAEYEFKVFVYAQEGEKQRKIELGGGGLF